MSENKTVGTEPMLGKRPVVNITDGNGETKEYPMRSLGIQDTFAIARIVASGAGHMGDALQNVIGDDGEPNGKSVGMLLLAGLPFAEREAMGLLASVLNVSIEDFRNPEKFPMGSEIEIVEALAKHQDLTAFFGKIKNMMERLPGVMNAASNVQ